MVVVLSARFLAHPSSKNGNSFTLKEKSDLFHSFLFKNYKNENNNNTLNIVTEFFTNHKTPSRNSEIYTTVNDKWSPAGYCFKTISKKLIKNLVPASFESLVSSPILLSCYNDIDMVDFFLNGDHTVLPSPKYWTEVKNLNRRRTRTVGVKYRTHSCQAK